MNISGCECVNKQLKNIQKDNDFMRYPVKKMLKVECAKKGHYTDMIFKKLYP